MFKRRRGPLHPVHLRQWVAPRKGFSRGWRYVRARLQRLPGSPHRIALGAALGVGVSFTPLFGLHIALAAGVAWVLRANMVAALLGTMVGNPLTFPLIAPLAIRAGNLMLGTTASETAGEQVSNWQWLRGLSGAVDSLLLPYLAGGALLGILVGAAAYVLLRPMVRAYQLARKHRKRRLRERPLGAPIEPATEPVKSRP